VSEYPHHCDWQDCDASCPCYQWRHHAGCLPRSWRVQAHSTPANRVPYLRSPIRTLMPSSCWACGARSGLHRVTALNMDEIKAFISAQVASGALKDPEKRPRAPAPLQPGHRVCEKHMPPPPHASSTASKPRMVPSRKRAFESESWPLHGRLDRDAIQAEVGVVVC
jgi:hypothetical protein